MSDIITGPGVVSFGNEDIEIDALGGEIILKPQQERSRDYFERQAQFGRRVIFSWRVSARWPALDWPRETPHPWGKDRWIDGVEFASEEAASAFNEGDFHAVGKTFDTWQEALEWLRS